MISAILVFIYKATSFLAPHDGAMTPCVWRRCMLSGGGGVKLHFMAHRKSVIKVVDFNVSYQVYVLIIRMFFIALCVQCVDG